MTLSIEEIELQLEEHPHDLSVWREWLAYCRRHNLPQNRYKKYLTEYGFLSRDFFECNWLIDNSKDLNILGGLYSNIRTLTISSTGMESTEGIEGFVAPNLKTLYINGSINLKITKLYPILWLHRCKIEFADNIDFTVLNTLCLDQTRIENEEVLYKAFKLSKLIIYKIPNCNIQLDRFKGLTHLSICLDIDPKYELEKMGNSDTLLEIELKASGYSLLEKLISNGWYPNLEHPMKGKNKR